MPPAEKFGTGKLPFFGDDSHQFIRGLMFFGFGVEFFFAEDGQDFHFLHDLAHVFHGVNDVSGAGFALGANHGCALGDAAQGFSEIAGAADERNRESVFVDVVGFVGGCEHFGLVDIVNAQFLKNLGFREMSDAALGHHWDRDRGHDLADLFGRSHARYAAFGADLRGDALESHDCHGAGLLGNHRLLGVGDVHNDAAFQHFGQACFQAQAGGSSVVARHGSSFLVELSGVLKYVAAIRCCSRRRVAPGLCRQNAQIPSLRPG